MRTALIRLALTLALALAFALAPPIKRADADRLVADLSNELIKISSNFTGTELILFGAIERDPLVFLDGTRRPGRLSDAVAQARRGDIVIVLRGQVSDATVRRKGRVGLIWMNVESQTFSAVPTYYFIATTRPLAQIAGAGLLRREELGFDNLNLAPVMAGVSETEVAPFRQALIRNKERIGLYRQDIGGVRMLGDTLFRVTIPMPANVPVGDYYSAKAYLVRDGQIVGAQSWRLAVQKTGLERWLFKHAHSNPLLYGLGAILLALAGGLLASAVFRK